jgi:hypothetical protein
MDMKMEDRRATPRFRVQFRTTVSDPTQPEGTGLMLDLSRDGCRLESLFLFLPGLSLELRIDVPGLEWPLIIDWADVQWVSEETAGLAFVRIRETEQQRLDDMLTARLARKSEDGDEEQFEAVPSEFHGLEQVLSKILNSQSARDCRGSLKTGSNSSFEEGVCSAERFPIASRNSLPRSPS